MRLRELATWDMERAALLVVGLGLGLVAPASAQSFTATFDTTAAGGRYAPRHVLAAWIERSDGTFVRTLFEWAARREPHLVAWVDAHPAGEPLDGITSATLSTHATRTVTWDLRDASGALVPDGTYVLRLELADQNSTSTSQNHEGSFTWTKGSAGFDMTSSASGFENVHIVYTPPSAPPPRTDAGTAPPPPSDGGSSPTLDAGTSAEIDAGVREPVDASVITPGLDAGPPGDPSGPGATPDEPSRGCQTNFGRCGVGWGAGGLGSMPAAMALAGLLLAVRRGRRR